MASAIRSKVVKVVSMKSPTKEVLQVWVFVQRLSQPTNTYWCGPPVNNEYWLQPMAKPALKESLAGRNHSLVAHTSKCGWAINNNKTKRLKICNEQTLKTLQKESLWQHFPFLDVFHGVCWVFFWSFALGLGTLRLDMCSYKSTPTQRSPSIFFPKLHKANLRHNML